MTHRTTKRITSSLAFLIIVCFWSMAFADTFGDQARASDGGMMVFGAAIALGIAALGGSLGQGKAAAAALDGIARNPGAADKIRGPMILGLALIESLVIYALIVALLVVTKF